MRPTSGRLRYKPDPNELKSALSAAGVSSAAEAAELAQDPQQPVGARQAACFALGVAKDLRSIGPLLSLLQDEEEPVVDSAIHALGQVGSRKATRRLCSLLRGPVTEARANHAICALWDIGDARAAAALAQLATNPAAPPFTRGLATEALGYLKPVKRRAVTHLLKLVDENDLWIRYSAACGLAFCGSPHAKPALRSLLTDHRSLPDRPSLAELAADALGEDLERS